MKDKILDRIEALSNKIEDLHIKRESIVRQLQELDLEIHVDSNIILELSNLLKEDQGESDLK